MKYRFTLIIVALILAVSCKTQQRKEFKNGLKQAENLNYSVAIAHFLSSWEKAPDPETARQLALSYKEIRDFELSEEWFARLDREGELLVDDLIPFAEILIANSKYEEANMTLNRVPGSSDSVTVDSPRLDLLKSVASKGKALLNLGSSVNVSTLSTLNSSASDFGVSVADNKLLFTSDRLEGEGGRIDPTNALKSERYGWTGNGFLKIYEAEWDSEERKESAPAPVLGLESRYHIGPAFVSSDKLFVTLTQSQKFKKSGAVGKSRDYTLFPEIYYSYKADSAAVDEFKSLPFNSPFAYSVSDPFFDETTGRLYFSSDMPGGLGGADIYYVTHLKDSTWSSPVNVGDKINTTGNERTPYLFRDGSFYFSSDGWGGLGGLDIFKSSLKDGKFGESENLGSPVNSNRDDFGFTVHPQYINDAFFSSDRVGGKGADDIYFADLDFRAFMILKGKVLDKQTRDELPDAVVTLGTLSGENQNTYVSEADGSFSFKVPMDQKFVLRARKTGYLASGVEEFATPEFSGFADSVIHRDILLDRIEVGRVYKLENIYYDFDKWNIRPDAEPELMKLVNILTENPTLKIELYSHTDSRGTKEYNLKLSKKRADSAIAFLIKNGINENRLKGIGFGEEQLLNQCSDGVTCTYEQHQENRRTEFKIIDY